MYFVVFCSHILFLQCRRIWLCHGRYKLQQRCRWLWAGKPSIAAAWTQLSVLSKHQNHQIIQLSVLQTCPGCRGIRAGACAAKIPAHRYPWLQVGWASRHFNGPIFHVFPWFGDVYFPGAIVTCFMNGSEWSLFSEISMDPLTSTNQSSQHLSSRLGSDGWQDSALHAHHICQTPCSVNMVISANLTPQID